MLRIKQKKEAAAAEAKAAEEKAAMEVAVEISEGQSKETSTQSGVDAVSSSVELKAEEKTTEPIFRIGGIGGKAVGGGAAKAVKKMTPGEIRIQKGDFVFFFQ